MHSTWFKSTFFKVLEFLEIKEGVSTFWREANLQKVWIIWSPLLLFNFKSFMDPNSLPFIRFQCILHDSGKVFSDFWNFYKLKRGNLISGGNEFRRKSELFGAPFCITIVQILWNQILSHSLDFNAFCMIKEYLSQAFEISTD